MQLTERIMTQNDCYKAGRTIVPKGIMVHSTGVAQPNVEVFLKLWNQPGVDKCAHAFVHENGVTETLPWNWYGWHAGSPSGDGLSANHTHISFEMLEPAGHTYSGGEMVGYNVEKNAPYFAKVYHNAVELCAWLCRRYGLDPMRDILDHHEGFEHNIASNHADVSHWFPKHGKSMDTLRRDVKTLLEGGEEMTQEQFSAMFRVALAEYWQEVNALPVSTWAEEAWGLAVKDGLFDGTKPGAALTREQASVVLNRLEKAQK